MNKLWLNLLLEGELAKYKPTLRRVGLRGNIMIAAIRTGAGQGLLDEGLPYFDDYLGEVFG